ncbi:unnamed protein product [Parnassius mnemosyne]|uniref:Helicase n=1 Tax=Parnassius mnemosyne TaxID=213953 RepID=A0AAV1LVZ3_9NEOP
MPKNPLLRSNFPFSFKRVQFPVTVSACYAMTVNKAQGQTLRVVGVYLSTDCFAHGQLYVGFSRVSSPRNLFVYTPSKPTSNVVYTEALS